ncbi:MAG: hypothetical protein OEZ58_03410 [Gammaproteobacteria bacterium]|nr:hypothetical protein [Gammaproteobacteria bacterium]MDH5728011.1 hypothetical protein [Gammaproteobacteria bacterium]
MDIILKDIGVATFFADDDLVNSSGINAKLAQFKQRLPVVNHHQLMPNEYFEQYTQPSSFSELLDVDTKPSKKLARIAANAFKDLTRVAAMDDMEWENSGLFVALPAHYQAWDQQCLRDFFDEFHDETGRDFAHYEDFSFFGATGALKAIAKATQQIQAGLLSRAVIGGIDAAVVFSDKSKNQMPCESAAFILLEPANVISAEVNIRIHTPVIKSIQSNAEEGLSQVLGEILLGDTEAPLVVCDLQHHNSDQFGWQIAAEKFSTKYGQHLPLKQPVTSTCEHEATSAALLVVMASALIGSKNRGHQQALVWCSSDDGEHAAMMLSRY